MPAPRFPVASLKESLVVLGSVAGLYGVRGWVKIHSYTEPRDAILRYREALLGVGANWREIRFAELKRHGKTIIGEIEGIDDRDVAAGLVGKDIAVSRDALPELGDGQYYWNDLEGLTVENMNGRTLGVVRKLMATGANDVMVVAGENETLIPFVTGDVVKDVDVAGGRIRVDWDWD